MQLSEKASERVSSKNENLRRCCFSGESQEREAEKMTKPLRGYYNGRDLDGHDNLVYLSSGIQGRGGGGGLSEFTSSNEDTRVISVEEARRLGREGTEKLPPGVVLLARLNDLEKKQRSYHSEDVQTVPFHAVGSPYIPAVHQTPIHQTPIHTNHHLPARPR